MKKQTMKTKEYYNFQEAYKLAEKGKSMRADAGDNRCYGRWGQKYHLSKFENKVECCMWYRDNYGDSDFEDVELDDVKNIEFWKIY